MKAADLSLAGASDQIQLGDMYPRTPVFTGNSPVPPPPPLAHHQPYEETFYNSSGLNPEYLGGEGHLEDYEETLTQYSDYYSRYPISNPYSDTLQVFIKGVLGSATTCQIPLPTHPSARSTPARRVGRSRIIEFLLFLCNYSPYKRLIGLKWFLKSFSTILHSQLNYHV